MSTPGEAVAAAQAKLAPVLDRLAPLLENLAVALERANRPSEADAIRRRYNLGQLRLGRYRDKF